MKLITIMLQLSLYSSIINVMGIRAPRSEERSSIKEREMKKQIRTHTKQSTPSTLSSSQKVEKTLETSYNGTETAYGNMFDVLPLRDLEIMSLDLNIEQTSVRVEIWTRIGSFADQVNSTDGWSLVTNTTLLGSGQGKKSTITFEAISLKKRKMQGFYITLYSTNLYYTTIDNMGAMEVYKQNRDMQVLVGIGLTQYGFGNWYIESRLWNGIINYEIERNDSIFLATKFQGGEKNFGSIFDIYPYLNLTITSLDLFIDSEAPGNVQVYTTDKPDETDIQKMQLIFNNETKGLGSGKPTPLIPRFFTAVNATKGRKRRFVVILDKPNLLYTLKGKEEFAAENDDLYIHPGSSILEYPLIDQIKLNNQLWNGIIRYTVKKDFDCQHVRSIVAETDDSAASYYGFMFNIQAKTKAIIIQNLEISLDTNAKEVNYTIWTQSGTYQDQQSDWDEASKGTLQVDSSKSYFDASEFKSFTISPDAYQAVFVKLSSASLHLSAQLRGDEEITHSYEYVQLTRGQSIDADFNTNSPYLAFIGEISYILIDDCSAELEKNEEISIFSSTHVQTLPVTTLAENSKTLKPSLYLNVSDSEATLTPTIPDTTIMPTTFIPERIITTAPSIAPTTLTPTQLPTTLSPTLQKTIPVTFANITLQQSPSPSAALTSFPTSKITSPPSIITSQPTNIITDSPTNTSTIFQSISPTNVSTLSPSISPTNESKIQTQVSYLYSLEHPPDRNTTQIGDVIDSTIMLYLNSFLEDPTHELFDLADVFDLLVESVNSDAEEFSTISCLARVTDNVCSLYRANVTTVHESTISSEFVRFFLYKYAGTLGSSMPFPSVNYTGIEPLSTEKVVKLFGDELSSAGMSMEESEFYEETVKSFLNEYIQDELTVTGVTTNSSQFGIVMPIRMRRGLQMQMRENDAFGELDISTGVVGEYIPPPSIDFDYVVQDSFDSHGDRLLNDLSDKNFFKKIENIETVSSSERNFKTKTPFAREEKSANNYDDDDNENLFLSREAIMVYGALGILLFFVIILVTWGIKKQAKKRSEILVCEIESSENNNFHPEHHYGQVSNREMMVHQNQFDPRVIAEAEKASRYYYGSASYSVH